MTHFLINIVVARGASQHEFGEFGLLFGSYLLFMGLVRSFVAEPHVVKATRPGSPDVHAQDIAGAALVAAVPVTLAIGGLLIMGPTSLPVVPLALGALAAGLGIAEDSLKAYALAVGRGRRSLVAELAWLGVQVPVTVAAFVGTVTIQTAISAWVVGAALSVLVLLWGLHAMPSPWRGARLVWGSRGEGASWAGDTALVSGVGQALPWVLSAVAGAATIAAYRGAMVLLGPTTVVFSGLRFSTLPHLASVPRSELVAATRRHARGFAALSLAIGLPLLLIPESIGRQVLGDSWPAAKVVLPAALLWRTLNVSGLPYLLALRASGDRYSALRVRTWVSGVSLLAGVSGAFLGGATGAFVGLAFAAAIALPLWSGALGRSCPIATAGGDGETELPASIGGPAT